MDQQIFWWIREAYGNFPAGEGGYPNSGQVIKYYRERKGLKPINLAHMLGISDVAVRNMENKNAGLDSISLRSRLAETLDIPPVLLGLDSLHPHARLDSSCWIQEGYPHFETEKRYPDPGQVVKHFREMKKASHSSWTQVGLGIALNISDCAVRAMENNNEALDSITRRRALAFLLDIPPALLGLDSLHYSSSIPNAWTQQMIEPWQSDTSILTGYHQSLAIFWHGYYSSTLPKTLPELREIIRDLCTLLVETRGRQKQQIQDLLCRYYQLAATIARDRCQYPLAFYYANQAVNLARRLNHHELIASAYLRRGFINFEQDNIAAAVADLDAARPDARYARPSLHGLVLQVAGHMHAHTAQSKTDKKDALTLFDQAGSIAQSGPFEEDDNFVRFNVDWYHAERAEVYLALHQPDTALRELDLAATGITPEQARRHSHLHIFRARAFIDKRLFADAANAAINATTISKSIHSNIQLSRLIGIYKDLNASSYGHNPEVARLGLLLKF